MAGGHLNVLVLYTYMTRGFKTYPNRDLPFWGKTSLNKNFARFSRTYFTSFNKILIEEFEKWPLNAPLIEFKKDPISWKQALSPNHDSGAV